MPHLQAVPATDDPQAVFEAHLEQIDRVISWSCRRMCLANEDADDFKSWVHLKLIEDDYRVFRQFSGRSSLTTFLTTVIQNLARDFRTHKWGRWRPTAEAQRLGVVAIQLETLVHRDEFSVDEAIEILRKNFTVRMDSVELHDLLAKLPHRTKRRVEGPDHLERVESQDDPEAAIKEKEQITTLDRTGEALTAALAELAVEDRLILKMHYQNGFTIAAVASTLGIKQRAVYTRRDRCLRAMKTTLESNGLDAVRVLAAVGWSGSKFEVDFEDRSGKHRSGSVQ